MHATRTARLTAATTLAAAALALAATTAQAATQPLPSGTQIADGVGANIVAAAKAHHLDPRSVAAIHDGLDAGGDDSLARIMRVSGIVDANHDGLDDDSALTVTVRGVPYLVHLGANGYGVSIPARPAAHAAPGAAAASTAAAIAAAKEVDKMLRAQAACDDADTWDMREIARARAELPRTIRVISDYDGNRDGVDDDGRLTVIYGGKVVTLTLANDSFSTGTVSPGPTWKHRAPVRHHRHI